MSDLATVLLAVAVVTGAAIGHAAPVWIAVGGAGVALALRRPLLLIACCALLASGSAARAEAGAAPMPAHRFAGWVTLLADPAPAPGGVKVVARLEHRHVELWAHGAEARALASHLAGERVAVTGVIRAVPLQSRRARCPPPRGRAARHRRDPRVRASEPSASRGKLGASHARGWSPRAAAEGRRALPRLRRR